MKHPGFASYLWIAFISFCRLAFIKPAGSFLPKNVCRRPDFRIIRKIPGGNDQCISTSTDIGDLRTTFRTKATAKKCCFRQIKSSDQIFSRMPVNTVSRSHNKCGKGRTSFLLAALAKALIELLERALNSARHFSTQATSADSFIHNVSYLRPKTLSVV